VNFFRLTSLDGAYDNVFLTLGTAPSFIEHAVRFSNARSIAQENLEFRAQSLILFGQYLLEQTLWTRT
jgi:hypothetical protein